MLKKIPYYSNLKTVLGTKTPQALGWGSLGISSALFLYPFITGDGALVNSMVCLALSSSLGKQILTQRGLFITLINRLLSKKALKTIDRGHVDRVISGFTLGMAFSVTIAAMAYAPGIGNFLWNFFAGILPWILFSLAILGIFWKILAPILVPILKGLGSLLKKLLKNLLTKKASKKSAVKEDKK